MFSDKHESYVIALRREFHRYPEIGGEEIRTSATIKRELETIGIPYETVGEYGLIGVLDTRRPGKTLALRADIDALPVQEDPENLIGPKNVVSEHDGVAHLCGHDGHAAMLLGAARSLHEIRESLCGRILFCFEQAEENGLGYKDMLAALAEKTIDGVWGIHLRWDIPSGRFSVEEGPCMAGPLFFDVTVKGRGGHGSAPDLSIDPVLCTANIIVGLSSVLSRELGPAQTGVLTIGNLSAGEVGNVIPETATFRGSIRALDEDTGLQIKEAFCRIVENTAAAHRCETAVSIRKPFGPVVNDAALSKLAAASVVKALGTDGVVTAPPWMASDSMAWYLKRYPGVYAFLGIQNDELGSGAVHHNPKFDIDESVLKRGVAATVQFALDFLGA